MRHAVVVSDLLHSDIRPVGMRRRFREQAVADAARFFPAASLAGLEFCPACESEHLQDVFERYGFGYAGCLECQSVFASQRPSSTAMSDYFRQTEAGKFRVEYLAAGDEPDVQDVLRSRFEWVATVLSGQAEKAGSLLDISTSEPFLTTELLRTGVCRFVYSSGPAPALVERLEGAGVQVVDAFPAANAITALEQLEHQANPAAFIASLHAALEPDGILFLTTRSISGLDLQVLWAQSPYIFFPEHLNLFSIEGLQVLLERHGFMITELSTPGHLDLDLIRQALEEDPTIEIPRFLRYLLGKRTVHAHRDFQSFLQKAQLSSHVRIVARTGGEAGT